MKIKFLKDYRYPGGGYSNKGDVQTFEDAEFAKWAIDNGFAEEVKESGRWKPKFGEAYFFLNSTGEINVEPWLSYKSDEYRYSMGECFKTEKAAEAWRGYRIAITTVRQDEGVLTPEEIRDVSWAQPIPYVGVSLDNELGVCQKNVEDEVVIASAIYFDTKEHAQASLDEHWSEWKIIANYDWSRE